MLFCGEGFMEKLSLIKEQIKTLQAELNALIENMEKDKLISSEVTEISEKLDKLIVELHRLA
jgi:predicted RNase H-like nuclease (RuvC/YqgF family)